MFFFEKQSVYYPRMTQAFVNTIDKYTEDILTLSDASGEYPSLRGDKPNSGMTRLGGRRGRPFASKAQRKGG